MTYLLVSVRFIDSRYHGLLDRGGPPEWPPSPYRLFQALVAGVARRGELVVGDDVPSNTDFTDTGKALGWLQKHSREHPPIIIAPKSKTGQATTRFVPNNDGDKKFDRQERLTARPTIPTLFLLEKEQMPEVHYVWDISSAPDAPVARIRDAARSLTALGWGIDIAFADANRADEARLQTLKGIRWYPKKNTWRKDGMLRTPTYDAEMEECTLCDLRHCHDKSMRRIEQGEPLHMMDKPKVFDRVLYTSTERPIGRPAAVFKLFDENDDTVAYPQSKLIHIAGMVKHLAIERMNRNSPPPRELRGRIAEQWVEQYVAGHQSTEGNVTNAPHTQFSYIPLQSIGTEHTDPAVRRVMIVAPLGDDAWLEHLARHLDGRLLKQLPNTTPTLAPGTRLERIDDYRKDGVSDGYLRASVTWASVTPVILPGHDDHKPEKTRSLIRKALQQSGVEQPCEFEWSAFSQFRKMLPAHKYRKDPYDPLKKILINYVRPNHLLDLSAVHLTIRFGQREDSNDEKSRWIPSAIPIPGPLAIGAGRHCGFGLMAGID